jgi:choline dehydrogenase-like flavoprotein
MAGLPQEQAECFRKHGWHTAVEGCPASIRSDALGFLQPFPQDLVIDKINWNFLSEGEPGTGNRRLQWPRGKTLGGTSSINGMLYVRGNPADYDNWAQMGCRGWSYEEVLPFSGASSRSVISFPSCETVRNYPFSSKCLVFICS